jgi:hypothetical protein
MKWLSYKQITNYNSENSLGFKFRKKRAERIKNLISACFAENGAVSIIDIGGTKTYWKIIPAAFLKANNVHITVVNLPSYTPPPPPPHLSDNEIFTAKEGDGCNLIEFSDNSFHIAHSNSVIEHVGNWDKKVMFAKELRRVANKYYVQTPNYWFPLEPHFMTPFFHWLPKKVRIKLNLCFNLGWIQKALNYEEAKQNVESCDLLSQNELINLFPDGILHKEKLLLFTKSLIVNN